MEKIQLPADSVEGTLLGGIEWQDPCQAGFHLVQGVGDGKYSCLNCDATFGRVEANGSPS